MTKNIIGIITLICIGCMLYGISQLAKAGDRERVYVQPTGEQIVVTDDVCDIPNLSPDNLPLRNAYGYDPKSERKVDGCALEYTNLIEVQLWDEKAKMHLELRIPLELFKERSKL